MYKYLCQHKFYLWAINKRIVVKYIYLNINNLLILLNPVFFNKIYAKTRQRQIVNSIFVIKKTVITKKLRLLAYKINQVSLVVQL